jgi:phosphoenolpyruvate synthase/pyruvate phosphate dikinase
MKPVGRLEVPPWSNDAAVLTLFDVLGRAGITARFVGGWVRDAVLGVTILSREPDLAVDKSPETVMLALKADRIKVGDVLTGAACSAGVYTGKARIILDPFDPSGLDADDILVTLNTDPSWTPLFLAAGAVVVNLGAVGSHASIVSRELGIPCVASVTDATHRIPDGATITVDGAAGTITIVALP